MPIKRQLKPLKNPKATILKLTFYMHKNVYKHLVILFLMNTLITMAIFGIFSMIDQQAVDVSVFGVMSLSLMITIVEHSVKTIIPLKTYAALSKTFGLGTVLIIFITASLSTLFIPFIKLPMIEPLVLYAFMLVFIRFYLRGALLRTMRRYKRRR